MMSLLLRTKTDSLCYVLMDAFGGSTPESSPTQQIILKSVSVCDYQLVSMLILIFNQNPDCYYP